MAGQDSSRSKTTPAVMCVKIFLQGFNALYLILGITILAIGIWTKLELFKYIKLTGLYYDNAAYVMIGVGVLIMLVSLGGFYCTAKNKVALLYIYAIFIGFVAILQIAAGIAGVVFHNNISEKVKSGLELSLKKENVAEWDTFQKQFQCCGVERPQDWTDKSLPIPESCKKMVGHSRKKRHNGDPTNSTVTTTVQSDSLNTTETNASISTALNPVVTTENNATTELPPPITTAQPESPTTAQSESTTNDQSPTTVSNPTTTNVEVPTTTNAAPTTSSASLYYQNGCYSKLTDDIKKYLAVIAGVAFGFVIIQIFGVILACCLAKKVNKNNYEQIY